MATRFLLVLVLLVGGTFASEIEALVEATKDRDRGVRYAAVQALGKSIGSAGRGMDALVAALDDPEWCVRQAAGHAIARVGEPAVPHLVAVLASGSVQARVEAVEALRRIGGNAAPHVIGALKDPDRAVVVEALEGLWLMGEKVPAAVAALEPFLEDENLRDRVVAYLAWSTVAPNSKDAIRKRFGDLWLQLDEKSWAGIWAVGLRDWLAVTPPEPKEKLDIADLASKDAWRRTRALALLHREGAQFKGREQEMRDLLDAEDPGVVRDAAIALERIGADPRLTLVRKRKLAAALHCRPLDATAVDELIKIASRLVSEGQSSEWAVLAGRMGPAMKESIPWMREMARRSDETQRAAAVWAIGRMGESVPAALGDRSLAVRAIAVRFVKDLTRLRRIARSRNREARVLAIGRLGELGHFEVALAAATDPDPLIRIAAVRALGVRTPAALTRDPERDVRIAVAQVRADVVLLRDANWRVRLAAIRSLARARKGAAELAPFLADRNLALSSAAAEALAGMGASAAVPVAHALANGNEAVWHYAPEIFEALGEAEALGEVGAAAVSRLVPLLAHPNMTVREVAARCLAAIGPAARGANGALVRALGDRYLGVVSHAALALGRIGISEPLLGALKSDRARVRAYAAFAIGWALGAVRKIDQVVYEPRLPVVDCGEPDPKITLADIEGLDRLSATDRLRLCRRGLRSRDVRIAYACVAQLDYDNMSPWECERAIELVLAEGFRKGHPFDVDKVRSYLGSNELPACLEFLMYPRETDWKRSSLFGHLHRAPRAENIPAILWFWRNEDKLRTQELDSLHQPIWKTRRYRAEILRWQLGREGSVWELVEQDRVLWSPLRWWLEQEEITPARASLLIEILEGRSGKDYLHSRIGALRALGRATGPASETVLRRLAYSESEARLLALAGLARRGDPIALVTLVAEAREDEEALGYLVQMIPDVGAVVLREQLADSGAGFRCADKVQSILRHESYVRGTDWTFDPFLGLEPSLPVGLLDLDTLEAISREVPGCRTVRIADAILERLGDRAPEAWCEARDVDEDSSSLALLWSARPRQLRSKLRAWAQAKHDPSRVLALQVLFMLGDPEDEALLAPRLVELWEQHEDCVDEPAQWQRKLLAAQLRAGLSEESSEDELAELLRLQCGFAPVAPDDGDSAAEEKETRALYAAAREGRGLEAAQSVLRRRLDWSWYPELPVDRDNKDWMRAELTRRYKAREHGDSDDLLSALALWPDPDARVRYWSALRAGRYRWVVYGGDEQFLTLGFDFATLPHWREELESNCCRVSGHVESIFEDLFGLGILYSCASSGYGEPPADRVRSFFSLRGGDMVWSPLARKFLPQPE